MPNLVAPSAVPLALGPNFPFVCNAGAIISANEFRLSAASLARQLTLAGEIINLCESRHQFLIAFVAALLCRRTTLLPPSHAQPTVAELVATYPGSLVIDDATVDGAKSLDVSKSTDPLTDFIAAIGHTSGSTSKPIAYAKAWSGLCATTALNAAAIRAAIAGPAIDGHAWIVATVPPQHMYGLEMSVLLPLLAGFGIHGGMPLLPGDVAAALDDVPSPRVLVSTPVHLRSLVESHTVFPNIAVVVSATAPLQPSLARRVEHRMRAVLIEVFGSTETCVIASRRTAKDENWRAYPSVRLEPVENGTLVRASWLARDQLLHDILNIRADNSFTVIGRRGDLIEVAGKRASLADLTRRMLEVPGVLDAIVFQPPGADSGRAQRCAALVVAPGCAAAEITRRFRQQVDPVFIPRPLRIVMKLPRNELGKLPLDRLLQLLTMCDDG